MWRSMTAAAVVVLMLGGFGAYHYFYKRGPAREGLVWQEKYTAKSAQSGLVLADGSTVALNVDSRLRYPVSFGGPTREVYLTGEAFFTIQKDPGHPFIIHTDKMTIRVLGTAFNVRCYPGDDVTETTLLQGSVEVTFPDRPADKIILKPTDKLVIRNEAAGAVAGDPGGSKKGSPSPGAAVTKYALTALTYYPARPNTIVETSWLDKKLVFDGEELQSVARRMERWFGVTIVIDNPALKHLPFTGLFEKEKIGEAMYALELSEKKIHYTIKDSVIHIF